MTFSNTKSRPVIISGPCSAESREQVLATAHELKKTGVVNFYRAGLWKPRTRPNNFEGVGEQGMTWLAEVKKEVGIPVMTEVADASHVESALDNGLDAVWIGARTTVSPFAVQAIADALKGTDVPVLVKNPMHADLGLWLGAIERFSSSTKGEVAALHRGFSNLGQTKYRNVPMWELPIGLKAELPEISLFCDPSHISGKPELIPYVSQKAMDLGMKGLMIESHVNPTVALSDSKQQVTPNQLKSIINGLHIREVVADESQNLELQSLRMKMDFIDEQLIELLKGRMDIAESVGEYKRENDLAVLQLERWRDIVKTRMNWSEELGIDREFILKILEQVHKESIRIQTDILNKEQ